MLILSRRPDEALFIGPDIKIIVISIKGNQVRLGIQAPLNAVVDREEIRARKQRGVTAVSNATPLGAT